VRAWRRRGRVSRCWGTATADVGWRAIRFLGVGEITIRRLDLCVGLDSGLAYPQCGGRTRAVRATWSGLSLVTESLGIQIHKLYIYTHFNRTNYFLYSSSIIPTLGVDVA
jgi:hypothetical protein